VSEPKANKEKRNDLSATAVVRLAEPYIRLFHSPSREPFASVYTKYHWENWRVRSAEFGNWLSAMCYYRHGGVPSQRAIADAINTLAGRALFGDREIQVYVRMAGHGEAIYVNLDNSSWDAV
jgi:hypothetical protein